MNAWIEQTRASAVGVIVPSESEGVEMETQQWEFSRNVPDSDVINLHEWVRNFIKTADRWARDIARQYNLDLSEYELTLTEETEPKRRVTARLFPKR